MRRRWTVWWLALCVSLAGGACTKRNPDFCCISAEDCASQGVDDPKLDCRAGFVCHPDSHECIAEACGNGVIDTGEACDDGGNTDGDGCSAKCDEADCFVPITHPTIQAAIADPGCARVAVYSGTYAESLAVDRSVSIVGVGAVPVVVDGLASGPVATISSGSVVLENLVLTERS